jgi:hypothetical protein
VSDNTPIQTDEEAAAFQAEIDAIVAKLQGGETISAEEGLKLLKIIGGLNANLTICNELLFVISEQLPVMVGSLADRITRRCGRTDKKLRRSVDKICNEHVESLWTIVRMRGIDVADAMRTPEETTDEA